MRAASLPQNENCDQLPNTNHVITGTYERVWHLRMFNQIFIYFADLAFRRRLKVDVYSGDYVYESKRKNRLYNHDG